MADLVETVTSAGKFGTLITALETAGLLDLLRSSNSMTLLAPTDDAFAQLPGDALPQLLQDLPRLKRVLSYHVVSGDMRSDDLAQIDEAPTLEGSVVAVDHAQGIRINDAQVTQTDILADNGVIHAIDSVLMPALIAGHS